MHRIRVSLGPYGEWVKIRDEDDPEPIPGMPARRSVVRRLAKGRGKRSRTQAKA
jgi:hypothetical protein